MLAKLQEFFESLWNRQFILDEGQVRADLAVMRHILGAWAKKGDFILFVRRTFNVRIITPKAYSEECKFVVIGEPVSSDRCQVSILILFSNVQGESEPGYPLLAIEAHLFGMGV